MARKASGRGRSVSADATEALDRAQEIVYDAWEAGTVKRRVALAEKALTVSPLCADAYVLLAQHAEEGSDKALDLWRRGVEAGRNALGESAFEELSGEFWGFHETRPYMRARFGLARALWARDARDEAMDHLRDMLRLNPNDNQGVRYVLMAFLVEAERNDELDTLLLKDYPEEGVCAWSWTVALAAFRRTGDDDESRALLARALADNGKVPAYLLGEKSLPKRLPPYMSPGGEGEAIYYSLDFRAGWTATPGAVDWLKARAGATKRSKRRKELG